jgi:hypothetical protein
MYSSYDRSSFAWFISGDGLKGIRRCMPKNATAARPGENDIGFNPTGTAPKVLAPSFVPAIS